MVKLGFIVEGETEKIILESAAFRTYVESLGLNLIPDVIDATGNGNLLPKNIGGFIQGLISKGATHIFILTDLESEPCVEEVLNRIQPPDDIYKTIVSRKAIEAWFLADSITFSKIFSTGDFAYPTPELEARPIEKLRQLFQQYTNRGIGPSKPRFAKRMVNSGFNISNAAKHPHCTSAKYFLDKMTGLAGIG